MRKCVSALIVLALSQMGCAEKASESQSNTTSSVLLVEGRWIMEHDGGVMVDPQTSGLAPWRGQLVSISDGSGEANQRRRIHIIDPASSTLAPRPDTMTMASAVRRSCFAQYLSDEPDLEAIVVDPQDDTVFYTVTEDATRSGALSERCQQQFENTGSTDYPTLLVRIKREESGRAVMTHVRPVQFPAQFEVGDFPNDGIEGLAISPERLLYLGLEKDAAGQPRIFSVSLNGDFWQKKGFAVVNDAQLRLPRFTSGNHPINGLEYYFDKAMNKGYVLAAARNDNQLWVLDATAKEDTVIVDMQFSADVGVAGEACETPEIMDNASIEGLAVIEDTLWLVNDPWKKNYLKNIKCPSLASHYKAMAPLLFSTPLDATWFQ